MPAPSIRRTSLAEWRAAGRTVDHRGHAIFVREDGNAAGEPLLLIHGFPTASWDFEAIWGPLATRYRLLTLDLIGFGFSAKPRRYAYSIIDQACLCEHVLVHAGVTSYHVLAHDYGVSVAQELLARQTANGSRPVLRSVALLNGGLFPETHRAALVQKLLLSPVGPLVARLTSRAAVGRTMRQIFGSRRPPDDALLDDFWALIREGDGAAIMHRLIGYIPERRRQRERWVSALQGANVPLTLINGPEDPISGAHMVERYRELVPSPDVTLLDGVGHYPQVEAPERVLDAYLAFRERRT